MTLEITYLLLLLLSLVAGPARSQLEGLDNLPGPPYLDTGANLEGRGRHPYLSGGNVYHPRARPRPPNQAEYDNDNTPPYYTGGLSTQSPLEKPVASLAQEISNLIDTLTRFYDRKASGRSRRPISSATKTAAVEPQYEDQLPGKYLVDEKKESAYSSVTSGSSSGTNQNALPPGWPRVFTVMGSAIDAVAGGIFAVRKEVTKLLDRLEKRTMY